MSDTPPKPATRPQQSFPLSPKRRRALMLLGAAFLLFPAGLFVGGLASSEAALVATGSVVGAIMLPFALYLFYSARYPRLDVGADGISIRGTVGRATIDVPWDSIQQFRFTPGSEGIVLCEPSQDPSLLRLRNWAGATFSGAPLYDDQQQTYLEELRYVPIEAFGWWLAEGSLRAAISQHAPALVEHYAEARSAALENQEKDKRVIRIVALFTGVLMIAAILLGLFFPDLSPDTQATLRRLEGQLSQVLGWILCVAFSIYATTNLVSAYRFARRRQFSVALLWLSMALVQLLLVLAILGGKN